MKTLRLLLALALPLAGIGVLAAQPPKPVNLIFDTDMGNDVDDALALGMIHALQTRRACQLLAVTLTNPDPLAGAYVAAVNTFYGRATIPIGVNPAAPRTNPSKFLKIAEARDAQGAFVFPHDFIAAKAPLAVEVLRRTLASAADHDVALVQVGFCSNLVQLLESPADGLSPLTGRELVTRKVRLLSIMAGAFQTVNSNNHILEYNVRIAIAHAQQLAADWPTPIVWSGWEIGQAITFPAAAVDHDFGYSARHPLPEAYQLYNPTPHERPCWDLTSVLHAVYPERGYFTLSAQGRVTVEKDGYTRFAPAKANATGRDRFLLVDREQAARCREFFAALVTEPPAAKP